MFGRTSVVNKDKVGEWMGGHSGGVMEEVAEQQVAAEAARVVMEILLVCQHFDDRGQQFTGGCFLLFVPGGGLCAPCVCVASCVFSSTGEHGCDTSAWFLQ